MRQIVTDARLIACCGLYCGACGSYLRERCPGCLGNTSATWCKVRACCLERGHGSCADCTSVHDVRDCGKFHNWISRLIGFVLRSDRAACIACIKEKGRDAFAREMASSRRHSMPR
ncbi:MAG: DUF3795 domain-containing protein [Candidatus Riflebacteria bacterium]|nr:DUF3795 domain-containing protein [Candidatus Riflebacteria bacterium]